jgi:hypothetical protein
MGYQIIWLIRIALMRQLLMLRTAGVVIPIYIILISVVTLLHRYNQHQVCQTSRTFKHSRHFHSEYKVLLIMQCAHDVTPDSEPGRAEGLQSLQPMPPQQHVISIQ